MPRHDETRRRGRRAPGDVASGDAERAAARAEAVTLTGQAATLLGDLEAAIMAYCWAVAQAAGSLEGAPQTVAEVQRALAAAGRRSAYTTIMTVMGRLVDKGLLQRSESLGRSGPGSSYRYWPAQSEADFLVTASSERVSALIATFGDVALAHFADALSALDPERLAALAHLGQVGQTVQVRPNTDAADGGDDGDRNADPGEEGPTPNAARQGERKEEQP